MSRQKLQPDSIPADTVPYKTSRRLSWPDAAKGVGILLVVLGHVSGGLIDSTVAISDSPLREIFMAIYVFHMPLFFFLSGLFVVDRIQSDQKKFLTGIARNLYYPYILWSFIQYSIISSAASVTNTPPGDYISTVLRIPIHPVSQFWFLFSLAAMHLLSLGMLPRIGPIGILIAAVILKSLDDMFQFSQIAISGTLHFYIFYAFGLCLGSSGTERLIRAGRTLTRDIVAAILGFALLITAVHIMIQTTTPAVFYKDAPRLPAAWLATIAWGQVGIGAGVLMAAVVILWSDRATGTLKWVLVYLGRKSMSIYILHVIFAAGCRIVLVKLFHVSDLVIILPVVLAAGLAGPLIIDWLLGRVHALRAVGLA